jgi:hypothetical protein
MKGFTDREKAIVAWALAVGIVVGLWAGLFMLPAEALDVPTDQRETSYGETVERAVYLPVPRIFFAVTVTAPVLAGWYSYSRLWTGSSEEPDEDVQNAVSDGGTDQ